MVKWKAKAKTHYSVKEKLKNLAGFNIIARKGIDEKSQLEE